MTNRLKCFRERLAFFVLCATASVACLSLTCCSGSKNASGSSGAGGGDTGGGGGGTGGDTQLRSGEYLWENSYGPTLSYSTIDPVTGALSAPMSAGSGIGTSYPNLAVSPSNKYLYGFDSGAVELRSFRISGPDPQITLQSDLYVPYQESLTLHPNGKFLYVIAGIQNSIQEFITDPSTGGLKLVSEVNEAADLRVSVIDPTGKFLFVNEETNGKIFAYKIDQGNGSLSAVAGSPFVLPAGQLPTSLTIGGSGDSLFLYAPLYTRFTAIGIAALAFDTATGALSVVDGSPFQTGEETPVVLGVDPSRKFLYATGFEHGGLYGFAIDPATGRLHSIAGSPFVSAGGLASVGVEPRGRFVYQASWATGKIYGFALNATTGALSPIAGSPFTAVQHPEGLTFMDVP